MDLQNSYEDAHRAAAYAQLEFPGTYYLAYRDLPAIFRRYTRGQQAVDFGCGTGRSTRFLQELGFQTVGVDIAEDMLVNARSLDPDGEYVLLEEPENRDGQDESTGAGLGQFPADATDLVLSAFTFDNIPGLERKVGLMTDIARLLGPAGIFVNLVSSPEIYVNEWASFSTKDYPENRQARSGDQVMCVITEIDDSRPVTDILCTDEDYRAIYESAGLRLLETLRPLGRPEEPQLWVNEARIPPWTIYVLGKGSAV
ncbi:MAG: class I SAM-dependent methyltransferase [bacterium]